MTKGKFEQNRHHRCKRNFGKTMALLLALFLIIGGAVGGTIAWLTDKTEKVENVFTTSDIGVELNETTENYKMIPGWKISKDPTAKVISGSEDCYLFVKVEETGGNVSVGNKTYNFDDFIAYAIEDGWNTLNATTYPGVYYRVIDENSKKNVDYNILGSGTYTDADGIQYSWNDNEVLTKPEVTKEMMDAVNSGSKPTLSFTAYAVQLWKSNESAGESAKFSAEEAWLKISTTN